MQRKVISPNGASGFTLIEVLVGIVILSVILGTMSLTLSQNYQEKNHAEQLVRNSQQLRSVESSLTNELRYATAGTGFTTTTSSISYYDLNNQPCKIAWNNSTKKITITNTSTNLVKATLNTPNVTQVKFQADASDATNRTVIITVETLDSRSKATRQNISKIRMLN